MTTTAPRPAPSAIEGPGPRPLFDGSNHSGFWIRVGEKYPNPVLSLDQQYHP